MPMKYAPLSGAKPPSEVPSTASFVSCDAASEEAASTAGTTVTNYDNEPGPSYFEKSIPYDKYMLDFPKRISSPSNSSQVDILSTFAESNAHQSLNDIKMQSATGFGAGLICSGVETLIGYPFIVLRRQCQLNIGCRARDLSPWLMLKAIFQIQQGQGSKALWKGLTCQMMLEGLQLTTESAISQVTDLPKELPSCSEGLYRYIGYAGLKTVSTIATLPILSAVLVDTVQSESARCDSATPMSCLKDAMFRLAGSGSSYQYRLLVPMHQLILPTVLYTLSWDVISQLVHSFVLRLCKRKQNRQADHNLSKSSSRSTLVDSVWPELVSGTVHCFVADLTLLPLEIVMNRLHVQGTRAIVDNVLDAKNVIPYQSSYNTAAQCVESLIETEGAPSLWKGLSAVLLQYLLRFTVVHTAKVILRRSPAEDSPISPGHASITSNTLNDSLTVNVEE